MLTIHNPKLLLRRLRENTFPISPYFAHRLRRRRLGAIKVVEGGEVVALNRMLKAANMTLELYKSTNSPLETDTLAQFTKADFAGYVAKTLVAATWPNATTVAGVTSSSYPVQSWVCTGVGNTIYGALYLDTDGITLIASDAFSTPRVLANTDTLSFTPRWESE